MGSKLLLQSYVLFRLVITKDVQGSPPNNCRAVQDTHMILWTVRRQNCGRPCIPDVCDWLYCRWFLYLLFWVERILELWRIPAIVIVSVSCVVDGLVVWSYLGWNVSISLIIEVWVDRIAGNAEMLAMKKFSRPAALGLLQTLIVTWLIVVIDWNSCWLVDLYMWFIDYFLEAYWFIVLWVDIIGGIAGNACNPAVFWHNCLYQFNYFVLWVHRIADHAETLAILMFSRRAATALARTSIVIATVEGVETCAWTLEEMPPV